MVKLTKAEAIKVLRSHLPNLDAAAIPTKSEVFVICGRPARDMFDAIELLTAPAGRQALTPTEGERS